MERSALPRWRVEYHRGLIREGQGRRREAARHYQAALEANPRHGAAKSRLLASPK